MTKMKSLARMLIATSMLAGGLPMHHYDIPAIKLSKPDEPLTPVPDEIVFGSFVTLKADGCLYRVIKKKRFQVQIESADGRKCGWKTMNELTV
jgi:hypothetical protein